jgi:hypothetical protein
VICEIHQTLWLDTPRGLGRAKFMISNGDDADTTWVCFYADGQIWEWQNPEVRVAKNITMGIQK